MTREARLLLAATAFLTRIPVGRAIGYSDEELNRSSRYFPLVGGGVGFAAAVVLISAASVLPLPVAVILSVVASVALTGAFHEDGLADSCDAFGGGMSREDVFRIMKDSRIGAFGAIGLILVLGLKITTLAHLPIVGIPVALVFAHAFSRSLCVLMMWLGTYARLQGGKTRPVAVGTRGTDASIALAIGLAPLAWAPSELAFAALAMSVAAIAIYAYFRSRIGGYTGDALGATQQVTEVTGYLVILGAQ